MLKRLSVFILVAACVLLLVSCVSDNNKQNDTGSSGEIGSTTTTTGALNSEDSSASDDIAQEFSLPKIDVVEDSRPDESEEVTFTTLNGDQVTYNKNTRKIVALSGCGDLVAFGIKPQAILADPSVVEKYKQYFEGVEILEYSQPYNVEEIMKYEPELILVYQMMDQENIDELSKIAPVIPLYRESFDFSERLGYIGEIFGMEDRANQLIKYAEEVQKNAVEEISKLNLKDKTVSLFYYMEGVSIPPTDFWYFNKILYDYLGMKRTKMAEEFLADENNGPFTPISNEKLKDYEGELVIYVDLFGEGEVSPQLEENPGWQVLNSVKENRIGIIDAMLYAEKDVLYLAEQYEVMLEALKKASNIGQ